MPEPTSYISRSPRFGLPFLFAAQAQKEFSVNEAHARADILLHPAITGELSDPPLTAAEGECWLVGTSPTGDWLNREGEIASMQAGGWVFVAPRDGMSVLDQSSGQMRFYRGGWTAADVVAAPQDGTTVDDKAREAISGLIAALVAAGILPES